MKRIILTSFGLHTPLGYRLIAECLKEECLEQKRIFLKRQGIRGDITRYIPLEMKRF